MASTGSQESGTGMERTQEAPAGLQTRAAADEEEWRRRRQIRAGKRAVSGTGRGGEETEGEGDRRRKRARVLDFLDVETEVDEDEDEEDEEGEEDEFINEGAELEYEQDQRMPPLAFSAEEYKVDVDETERRVRERYSRPIHTPYVEDGDDVQQQPLLPTLGDPKLFRIRASQIRTRVLKNCGAAPVHPLLGSLRNFLINRASTH